MVNQILKFISATFISLISIFPHPKSTVPSPMPTSTPVTPITASRTIPVTTSTIPIKPKPVSSNPSKPTVSTGVPKKISSSNSVNPSTTTSSSLTNSQSSSTPKNTLWPAPLPFNPDDSHFEVKVEKTSKTTATISLYIDMSAPGLEVRLECPVDHGDLNFGQNKSGTGKADCVSQSFFRMHTDHGALITFEKSTDRTSVLYAESISKPVTIQFYLDILDSEGNVIKTIQKNAFLNNFD